MSGFRVNLDIATREIGRLRAAGFTPPPDTDDLAKVWVDVLAHIEPAELREAVSAYVSGDNSYWPKPGRIKALAIEYRGTIVRGGGEQRPTNDPAAPCEVCGARVRAVTRREIGQVEIADGRKMRPCTPEELDQAIGYGVVHNHLIHERRRVPMIGYSDAPNPETA
jgi:hypothetical protein